MLMTQSSQLNLLKSLEQKFLAWKSILENHGLTVNLQKTKIMHCKYHDKKDTRKFPCGVYRSGVGRNSIFSTLAIQIFLPQGEKAFQREMLFLICVSIMAICAGKNMLMQHWIFSICTRKMAIYIGKIVTCQGKMPFLYYYLLLWYSKFQYQIKLIAQCLYFLIRNNT